MAQSTRIQSPRNLIYALAVLDYTVDGSSYLVMDHSHTHYFLTILASLLLLGLWISLQSSFVHSFHVFPSYSM